MLTFLGEKAKNKKTKKQRILRVVGPLSYDSEGEGSEILSFLRFKNYYM